MSSWTYFTAPVQLLTNANGGKNGGKFRRLLAVVVFLLSERRGQNKKLIGSWVDLCLKDFREMATQFGFCLLKRLSENGNVTGEVIFSRHPFLLNNIYIFSSFSYSSSSSLVYCQMYTYFCISKVEYTKDLV